MRVNSKHTGKNCSVKSIHSLQTKKYDISINFKSKSGLKTNFVDINKVRFPERKGGVVCIQREKSDMSMKHCITNDKFLYCENSGSLVLLLVVKNPCLDGP